MPTFASLFDQEVSIGVLRRAFQTDSLAGTYLFLGPAGVGKRTLSHAFAQAAACLQPLHPFDSCGICESCRLSEAGTHPEIVFFAPLGEQTQIGQFWSREGKAGSGILSQTLAYAPALGRRRVYIVENAESLSEPAANSLLKVLEEPPPYALFILLATQPARLLPTLVSRSQMVRLSPAPADKLAAYLQEQTDLTPERAATITAYAEGRIGQAVHLARNARAAEEAARILDFAEGLPEAPRVRALRAGEQMRTLATQVSALLDKEAQDAGEEGPVSGSAGSVKEKISRRQLAAVFDLLIAFYRDLLNLSVGGRARENLVNRDRVNKLNLLAQVGTPDRWIRCLDALLLAKRRLEANANIALVTDTLAMSLLAN